MAKEPYFAHYKGVKILVTDFGGLQGKELVDAADRAIDFVKRLEKKDLNVLVNVINTEDSPKAQLKFAEAAKVINPYSHKIAVVGLTIIKNAIMNVIIKITGADIKGFKDLETAKNWVTDTILEEKNT